METNSLHTIIEQLEKLFSVFNERFFNNELQKPVITVSPDTTKGAYGWCTSWKAWKQQIPDLVDGGAEQEAPEGYYEINMCAEYLARPFLQTCSTLIHEMVHLKNLQDKIQDTSRGGKYHNKKFKEIAEQHGLIVEQDSKYGWCRTRLTDESAAWIISVYTEQLSFDLYRSKLPKVKAQSKSSSRKYVCPCCGTIIRATKEVHVTCSECGVEFEEES
jgi:rubrerythrin